MDEMQELALALAKFLKSRDKQLSMDPMAELAIPCKGAETLIVPILFLAVNEPLTNDLLEGSSR